MSSNLSLSPTIAEPKQRIHGSGDRDGIARRLPAARTPAQTMNSSRDSQMKVRLANRTCAGLLMLGAVSVPVFADETDEVVRAHMQTLGIPGLSLAVIKDGEVIKEAAYGVANVELDVPASTDTVYVLASMTKVFTAAAIVALAEEGHFSLDDPVSTLVAGLPESWSQVTVRHCLSHTSGLPDAITDEINVKPVSGSWEGTLEALADAPVREPGTVSAYNQTGYAILGKIIEAEVGLSYEEFIEQRLLKRAGMEYAQFGDAWVTVPHRATLYTLLEPTADRVMLAVENGRPIFSQDGIRTYGSKTQPDHLLPNAGLNASIEDLIRWEQAIAAGDVVGEQSLQQMMTPYVTADGVETRFGLGFLANQLGGLRTVSYGGGAAAWRIAVPEESLIVIVLTNLQAARPETFIGEIAALYSPAVAAALDEAPR
jgi:D-alanyl-D-alanine carboxypeptidase